MPDFGATGSLPTLLQNTLRLRGTALSAVGRPGTENLDATRKTEGGKKRPAKFMCSFPFAVVSLFLMLLTHLTVQGQSSPDEIFQIWKWKKKLHCNGSLWLYLDKSGITCCAVMTSYTARSLRLSCWITVFFRQDIATDSHERLRWNHGLWKHKAQNHMTFHSKTIYTVASL